MNSRLAFSVLVILICLLALAPSIKAQVTASPIGLTASLDANEESEQSVTLSNLTDNDLSYKIKVAKADREGQRQGPRRDDPRRDEPSALKVLVLKSSQVDNYGWRGRAWLAVFDEQDEEADLADINNVADIDLSEYDLVATGENQPADFYDQFAAHREQFMEYVADGGVFCVFAGSGGIRQMNLFKDDGDIVASAGPGGDWADVNPDFLNNARDGLVANIEDDLPLFTPFDFFRDDQQDPNRVRIHMRGNALNFAVINPGDLPEEGIWYYSPQGANTAILADWPYGSGYVLFTGISGTLFWEQNWQWSSMVECTNLTKWADGRLSPRWLAIEPKEGTIDGGEDRDINITLSSNGMAAGTYDLVLQVYIGADENTSVQMSCVMTVEDRTSTISGRITDLATGNPINGATASLDYYIVDRNSNENGNYQISDLPPHVYNVTYSHPDYLPVTRRVNLGNNAEVVNVGLRHSECNLSTNEIAVQLAPDTDTEVDFSITNSGNGPLTFSAERKLLGDANAEPWEVRRTMNIGQSIGDDRIEGVAFDGENFFFAGAAGDAANTIYVVNREGQRVRNFNQLGNSRYGMKDLEFDGDNFWGSGEQAVYCFNADGEQVTTFQGPFNPTNNIAYDAEDEVLWFAGTTTNISAYDRAGNALNHVLNRKGLRIYGLTYWPDDPDGYNLYIVDSPAAGIVNIHKMNTANGDTMLAYSVPNAANVGASGVFITNTYDVYSWVLMAMSNVSPANGGDGLSIYQLDARKDWFALNPTEGVIEAGARQDFVLNLDANGLPAVLFEGEIVFTHDGIGGETHLPISLDVVEGPVQAVRNIPLAMGWNMISANLQPDPAAFAEITHPLVDSGVIRMVKDDRGHFMTVGANAFNNLPDWGVSEGYLVKVSAASVLQVNGMTVMADDPIHLDQGWQMISYYPRRAVAAPVAFSAIDEQLQIVKDGFGNFYLPAYNYDNMGLMHEGLGYQVRVSAAVDLVYQIQAQGRDAAPYLSVQGRDNLYSLHAQTGSNMSMLVEAPGLDGEIGVYASGELVGTGVLDRGRAGVAIWGDDLSTSVRDGAVAGENLEVRLMNELGEQVLSTAVVAGELTYSTDGFAVVRASESANPSNFGLAGVYPNPFNGRTTARVIVTESGKVQLALYDLGGRMIREVVVGRYEAGSHNIAIDAGDLASGVYLLRVNVAGRTSQMKIALVR